MLHRYRDAPDDPDLAAEQDRMMEVMVAGALGLMALGVVALAWVLF